MYTVVAKIVRTTDRFENIDLFCLQNMILFHNVHETCRWLLWAQQLKRVVLFLTTFNFNIWYVHSPPFAAITAAHLSGIVSIYILRTSTLMLSHVFCNSSKRLSFECTIDLSSLFSNSPQICSMGLRSGLWGASPSFSVFQQIPSLAGSSSNSFVLYWPILYIYIFLPETYICFLYVPSCMYIYIYIYMCVSFTEAPSA